MIRESVLARAQRWVALTVCLFGMVPTSGAATPPFPEPAPGDEKILLPVVASNVGGKFDSRWSTRLLVYNEADTKVDYLPNFLPLSEVGKDLQTTFLPKRSSNAYVYTGPPGPNLGVLLYVNHDATAQLHFNLRLSETTLRFPDAQTEIPVVREHEFKTGRIELLGVEKNPRRRLLLRIYDVDLEREAGFIVRIFRIDPAGGDELIAETRLATHLQPLYGEKPYPYLPGYTALNLDDAISESGTMRIEVESTNATRFWAFVSATDNVTQEIRLTTPQ